MFAPVHAMERAGLSTAAVNRATDARTLTGLETLRPMQTAATNVPLPDGPALVLIEDTTGAGTGCSGNGWAFPARAGMIRVSWWDCWVMIRVPRPRGDDPIVSWMRPRLPERSPPARPTRPPIQHAKPG